jgi:hypothetical protein
MVDGMIVRTAAMRISSLSLPEERVGTRAGEIAALIITNVIWPKEPWLA